MVCKYTSPHPKIQQRDAIWETVLAHSRETAAISLCQNLHVRSSDMLRSARRICGEPMIWCIPWRCSNERAFGFPFIRNRIGKRWSYRKGPLGITRHTTCLNRAADVFERHREEQASWTELYAFEVDRAADAPVFRQIYLQLRSAILSGTLRPATKLPSTRELAAQLGVSRSAVVSAFEQLVAEGYAFGRGRRDLHRIGYSRTLRSALWPHPKLNAANNLSE